MATKRKVTKRKNPKRATARKTARSKMRSGSKKLAAWVRSQMKKNPATLSGFKWVKFSKTADGKTLVTAKKT